MSKSDISFRKTRVYVVKDEKGIEVSPVARHGIYDIDKEEFVGTNSLTQSEASKAKNIIHDFKDVFFEYLSDS